MARALARRPILVLDVGGTVAGYASFASGNFARPSGRGGDPGTLPSSRISGDRPWRRLFTAVLKRVKSRGYSRVLVRALTDNDRANAFYMRHGGKIVARTDETLGGRNLPASGTNSAPERRL